MTKFSPRYVTSSIILLAMSALTWGSPSENMLPREMPFMEFEQISTSIESPFVHYIDQDSTGLIWICTNKGLFYYDGYAMTPCFKRNGPYHKQMQCMEFYGDKILAGTDMGIVVYDRKIKGYTDNSAFSGITRIVNSIVTDRKGRIWIGHSDGLHVLDSGKVSRVKTGIDRTEGHCEVFSILEDRTGFYIGTYGGLYVRQRDGNFVRLGPDDSAQKYVSHKAAVYSIASDSLRQCLWLGTNNGLWKYDLMSGRFTGVQKIRNLRINAVALDRTGKLIIGSSSGLWVYDGETLVRKTHDIRSDKSLSNNNVEFVLIDRDGNAWIGTHNGISLSRHMQAGAFIPLSEFSRGGEGLTITTMITDSKGGLWCGGLEGAVYANPGSKADLHMNRDGSDMPAYSNINSFYEDEDGDVWAASAAGILLYDPTRKSFRLIKAASEDYSLEWCQAISGDRHGKICVGTFSSGIFIFDKKTLVSNGEKKPIRRLFDEFPKGQVKQIEAGKDGSWWILFYNRKIALVSNTGEPLEFNLEDYGHKVFPTRLAMDSDGFLWIGYNGGLIRISPDQKTAVSIPFPDTSKSNVTSLTVSPDAIWSVTGDGFVRRTDRRTFEQTLLPLPVRRYTAARYAEWPGALLLGGVDGITVVDLPLKMSYAPFRKPVITSIRINGKEHTGVSPLELRYNENDIAISFSSLNYSPSGSEQYAYMLEPSGEGWRQVPQGANYLSFVNLNPGHYKLMICMTNGEGLPVEDTVRQLDIRIAPQFFQSTAAYILYIMAFATFIVWIMYSMRMHTRLRQEQFEKQILQAQASAKIDFLTDISHDLKTPLSLIIGPATVLQGKMPDEESRKGLDTIRVNAEKLNRLICRLLEFRSQDSDTGQESSVESAVDLVSLAGSIAERYRQEASGRNIRFSCMLPPGSIFYRCDPHKMESILDNLLSNAFKYTPDDGKITMSMLLIEDTGQICITVADTGIGIPQEELPHVFHRFFQSSRTRDTYPGSGIGLSIVKKYVTDMGGTVEADSSGQSGTSFIIGLPLKEHLATDLPEGMPSGKDKKKPSVLVVEDNLELASFISSLLENTAVVYTAGNGRDGLALFRRIRPALVITDLMMPFMDGEEMCSRIRKDEYGSIVPIIMLTAKSDSATELRSLKANIDYFIAKPFDANKLRLQVEHCLKIREKQKKEAIMDATVMTKAADTVSGNEKFILQITGIIESHISSPGLNVSFLAEQARLSPKQLTRQLKAVLGCTPVEYIRNIRIKQAAAMLERGGYFTIAEVMYAVGFTDASYFARCFQEKFGCTPTQFKKRHAD